MALKYYLNKFIQNVKCLFFNLVSINNIKLQLTRLRLKVTKSPCKCETISKFDNDDKSSPKDVLSEDNDYKSYDLPFDQCEVYTGIKIVYYERVSIDAHLYKERNMTPLGYYEYSGFAPTLSSTNFHFKLNIMDVDSTEDSNVYNDLRQVLSLTHVQHKSNVEYNGFYMHNDNIRLNTSNTYYNLSDLNLPIVDFHKASEAHEWAFRYLCCEVPDGLLPKDVIIGIYYDPENFVDKQELLRYIQYNPSMDFVDVYEKLQRYYNFHNKNNDFALNNKSVDLGLNAIGFSEPTGLSIVYYKYVAIEYQEYSEGVVNPLQFYEQVRSRPDLPPGGFDYKLTIMDADSSNEHTVLTNVARGTCQTVLNFKNEHYKSEVDDEEYFINKDKANICYKLSNLQLPIADFHKATLPHQVAYYSLYYEITDDFLLSEVVVGIYYDPKGLVDKQELIYFIEDNSDMEFLDLFDEFKRYTKFRKNYRK